MSPTHPNHPMYHWVYQEGLVQIYVYNFYAQHSHTSISLQTVRSMDTPAHTVHFEQKRIVCPGVSILLKQFMHCTGPFLLFKYCRL